MSFRTNIFLVHFSTRKMVKGIQQYRFEQIKVDCELNGINATFFFFLSRHSQQEKGYFSFSFIVKLSKYLPIFVSIRWKPRLTNSHRSFRVGSGIFKE